MYMVGRVFAFTFRVGAGNAETSSSIYDGTAQIQPAIFCIVLIPNQRWRRLHGQKWRMAEAIAQSRT